MLRGEGSGGGISQLKPALCVIGRYRGVSQLYCCKSWLDGPLLVTKCEFQCEIHVSSAKCNAKSHLQMSPFKMSPFRAS